MAHVYIAGLLILHCYYQGVRGRTTVCSEAAASANTDVIRMCESGSRITNSIVIDTFDTGDPDVYSCSCVVTPYKAISSFVNFGRAYQVEQNKLCGSRLSVESPEKDTIGFECVWPDQVYSGERKLIEIVLSRTDRSNPWQHGYCLQLDIANDRWNFTCLPPVKVTTKPLVTTALNPPSTTQLTTAMNPPSTTQLTTTTTQPSSTSTATSVSVTQTPPSMDTNRICSTQTVEVFSTATVVIPIVVVVLIATVATIANVILYRRRLSIEKELKNKEHVLKPAASVVYDSIDTERMEPPHTYADMGAGRTYVNTTPGATLS